MFLSFSFFIAVLSVPCALAAPLHPALDQTGLQRRGAGGSSPYQRVPISKIVDTSRKNHVVANAANPAAVTSAESIAFWDATTNELRTAFKVLPDDGIEAVIKTACKVFIPTGRSKILGLDGRSGLPTSGDELVAQYSEIVSRARQQDLGSSVYSPMNLANNGVRNTLASELSRLDVPERPSTSDQFIQAWEDTADGIESSVEILSPTQMRKVTNAAIQYFLPTAQNVVLGVQSYVQPTSATEVADQYRQIVDQARSVEGSDGELTAGAYQTLGQANDRVWNVLQKQLNLAKSHVSFQGERPSAASGIQQETINSLQGIVKEFQESFDFLEAAAQTNVCKAAASLVLNPAQRALKFPNTLPASNPDITAVLTAYDSVIRELERVEGTVLDLPTETYQALLTNNERVEGLFKEKLDALLPAANF